ncbi:MAG: lysophospholipid acyltransferase family protein [Polyangiales bacterium]
MPTQADPRVGADRSVLGPALAGARTAALGAWTIGVAQTALVHDRMVSEGSRIALRQQWVSFWARGLLTVFGVEQRWLGAEVAAPRKARLVVANHRSPLDIILMLGRFRGSVLGRHDLESWPLLGWAARQGGTIFVDREDARSGVRAIREIRKRLSTGQTVIVFPEGTTHQGDEVHPFLGGAFSAVRGLDAELLPVGVAYDPGSEFVNETFGEHLQRMAQRPKTRVALCVGEPEPALGDREAMAARMHEVTQALVHRARRQLGS